MIAVDHFPIDGRIARAVKSICHRFVHVLIHELDRVKNLERRSRRIQPLRDTVNHRSVSDAADIFIPVRVHFFRIKIRVRNHGKNPSGFGFADDHGTFMISQSVLTGFLQLHIKRSINVIAGVQLVLVIIGSFFRQCKIGVNQLVVFQLLNAAASLCRVSDHMGKQLALRIFPDLFSVITDLGLRENFAIRREDLTAQILGKHRTFTPVILIFQKLPVISGCIGDHVHKHRNEHSRQNTAGNENLLPDSFFLGFFPGRAGAAFSAASIIRVVCHKLVPPKEAALFQSP